LSDRVSGTESLQVGREVGISQTLATGRVFHRD